MSVKKGGEELGIISVFEPLTTYSILAMGTRVWEHKEPPSQPDALKGTAFLSFSFMAFMQK